MEKDYFGEKLNPSEAHVWEKYYPEGASVRAREISTNQTVWDVIEKKLEEYYDIPAVEYFRNQISRPSFRENVYVWARTFRAMGVEQDEVVPVYGPFFPDIMYMTFALNMIGAVPYFLKLAISPKALEEETRNSKIAVVYDGMWKNVQCEFSKDKFKNVIVASSSDAMPSPKKEIVSFLSRIEAKKNRAQIPNEKKYIWLDTAREISNYYTGNVKTDPVLDRIAFITSSSGTTGGIVKGTCATNRATIAQLQMGTLSGTQYYSGDRCLCNFPPTASTSLNLLFLMPLYRGLTIVNDPRVSEKNFYDQIMTIRPNAVLTTGSMWEAFFYRVETEMKLGKKFDFSFAKGWALGGDGTNPKLLFRWNNIMQQCGAPRPLFCGYGLSELFSAVSSDAINAMSNINNKRPVIGTGIPFTGMDVGIFDKDGKELPYNTRGELWVKSESMMAGYYMKPELTRNIIIDGWLHTGDMVELSDDGYIYPWGRLSDKIQLENGEIIQLFDVAVSIKSNNNIVDAIVVNIPTSEDKNSLFAHIVWENGLTDEEKMESMQQINSELSSIFQNKIAIIGYKEHSRMLPYSPTTLKKDKTGLAAVMSGYRQIYDGRMYDIELSQSADGNIINYYNMEKGRGKKKGKEKNKRLI